MRLMGLIPLAGIVVLLIASISDGLAKEKMIYDKQCIERGMKAEIESDKTCGRTGDSVSCFSLDHGDCLLEESGNPPTGWAYFSGILMVILGGLGFGLMWAHDRDMKHTESMKALD